MLEAIIPYVFYVNIVCVFVSGTIAVLCFRGRVYRSGCINIGACVLNLAVVINAVRLNLLW